MPGHPVPSVPDMSREEFVMADIILDFEHVESMAQRLDSGREDVARRLEQLKNIADELIQDGSSKKFMTAYRKFNTGVTQTLEGLEEMSNFLAALFYRLRELDQVADQQE